LVKKGQDFYSIDKNEKIVTSIESQEERTIKKKSTPLTTSWVDKYDRVDKFYSGRCMVRKDGKYGYVNRDGKEVIPVQYERANPFYHNRARVKFKGRWFFINENGHCVSGCP
jgi:ribosomal protein L24E